MYRLSRRFRRRFGKDKEEKKDKSALDYVIVLLDGSDLSLNLHVSFFYDYFSINYLLDVNDLFNVNSLHYCKIFTLNRPVRPGEFQFFWWSKIDHALN